MEQKFVAAKAQRRGEDAEYRQNSFIGNQKKEKKKTNNGALSAILQVFIRAEGGGCHCGNEFKMLSSHEEREIGRAGERRQPKAKGRGGKGVNG